MPTNTLAQVLAIVHEGFDASLIALRLASTDPELFLRLHHEAAQPTNHVESTKIIAMLLANQAVSAIQSLRASTPGMNLRDAVTLTKLIHWQMYQLGIVQQAKEPDHYELPVAYQQIYNQLSNHVRTHYAPKGETTNE